VWWIKIYKRTVSFEVFVDRTHTGSVKFGAAARCEFSHRNFIRFHGTLLLSHGPATQLHARTRAIDWKMTYYGYGAHLFAANDRVATMIKRFI
jgi:hypothetical protein